MKSANQKARHGTCVVSFDVASSFQSFRTKGLRVLEKGDPIFARLRQNLLDVVVKAMPNIEICPIDKDEFRSKIWEQVNRRVIGSNRHAVLVTCSEMAELNLNEGLSLSINRLFDTDGNMLGYGPRPGFEYLNRQFDELARKIAGRPVVLAKEGAFRGHTCQLILKELAVRNVKVVSLIIGFCDVEAKASIEQEFNGEFGTIYTFDKLIEWVADRDLIPFMPGCGRVLGERSVHSFMPVRTADGFSCSFPYVLPFGKMEKWASLSSDDAHKISAHFLDFAIELFDRLDEENGRQIMVDELLGDNPRVSIPVEIASEGRIPNLNRGIVGFLEQARKKLD
ncbi:hypothetical protein IPJ70_04450 [Candidatus Campbellbacteria bacterium]|nr:MAG: hypothetical protein IPJ70_04450 [Candidatus Campbellbacteria bacterium]